MTTLSLVRVQTRRESYLFFLQFELALTGAQLEDVELYGPGGATLQSEEYVVDKEKHAVTHAEGIFKSQLSRIVLLGKQHKKRKHHQKHKKEL
ncbi:myeloid-derived growth factor-like [Amphiura filiformis]|uniref:myeloid-derived growth factor-like n=1 Tax=Amphiura filiformis TaxID=82378 RepID=UPI003B21FA64